MRSLEPVPEEAVYVADVEGDDPGSPEESVGNMEDGDGMHDGKPLRGNRIAPQLANLGCFAWQELNISASEREPVPGNREFHATEANRGSELDFGNLFVNALNAQQEVFEITMDIQPRDVHNVNVGGKTNWILNEKPKKRAEVQFRAWNDDDKVGFLKAMQGELGSYLDHEAVEIAKRHGIPASRILGMRWVLTWKAVTDENTGAVVSHKPKARLIIKGFQDPDLLHLKRDSPTLATQSRNMILALSAANNWRCFLGDIKTAFLNGDKTEAQREIYAEPPEEVKRMLSMRPNELFRILKAVYGLLHAPRAWADKLASELQAQGWIQSRLEPCVWRLYDSEEVLCGLIGIHVDDILCCGQGVVFEQKIANLKGSFPFGAWRSLAEGAIFCGCELKQREDGSIELNQERYGEGVCEIPITRNRKERPEDEATEEERKLFRAALGALSWRATQSAPWLAASVSYLQGCHSTAKVGDLIQANKLIRMQRTYSQQNLVFTSQMKQPTLLTYHDASYACRRDGSSQGGVFSMLVDHSVLEGKPSKFSPFSWQSRKLPRVCRSSTGAEIQTGSHAVDSHEFTKQMFLEWHNKHVIDYKHMDETLNRASSIIVTDSKNLYDSVSRIETSGLQLEERRLALEVLSIRERVHATGMQLRWVDSDQQLADNLSKPFSCTTLLGAID